MQDRDDAAVGLFGTPATSVVSREQLRGLIDQMRQEDRATREMDPQVFRALQQAANAGVAAPVLVEAPREIEVVDEAPREEIAVTASREIEVAAPVEVAPKTESASIERRLPEAPRPMWIWALTITCATMVAAATMVLALST